MGDDDTNHIKPHAILVAYPLQGHVIPSVHLAVMLASRGFTITFINTHCIHHQKAKAHKSNIKNSNDIFADLCKSDGLDIRYITVSDGLPLGFDRSLNHDQFMASLLHVFSAHVEEAVEKIVTSGAGPPVNCLIADTFFVWPSMVAKKFGLTYISFWTEPALVFTLYYHLDLLRLNCHFGCNDTREDTIDYIPGVKGIEPKDMMSYLQESDTSTVCHQIIFKCFEEAKQGADFVICNSVNELEADTIAALNSKKPFYAIGPIFPAGFTKSTVATSLWSESDCNHWLDTKPIGSVLYISFGSYAHVSKNDLTEIANGLLVSKVSFVWVLRSDIVSSDDPNPLPEGFEERIVDQGMIIPWCCQIQVLSHPAIGGFLTHCGWNSILESIWCKVPLLCFPLLTDQFTNRKLVVDDWKIGTNLKDQLILTCNEVSDKVIRLMGGKSRGQLEESIDEVKKILENAWSSDGSSEKSMSKFINDLKMKLQARSGASSTEQKSCISNGS